MSGSSPLAVSMMMGTDSVRGLLRSRRQTVRPSTPGSMRSKRIRSGGLRLGGRQGLLARRHAGHLVSFLQQMVADQLADVLLILDDEHGFFDHAAFTADGSNNVECLTSPCIPECQPLTVTASC